MVRGFLGVNMLFRVKKKLGEFVLNFFKLPPADVLIERVKFSVDYK